MNNIHINSYMQINDEHTSSELDPQGLDIHWVAVEFHMA